MIVSSSGRTSALDTGGMLDRSSVDLLPLPGVAVNEPETMRNLFLNVAQFHDMFANMKAGRHTSRLSPFTAALISQDLNCKCVRGPGDASSRAMPATNPSKPLYDRSDEFANMRCSGPGP